MTNELNYTTRMAVLLGCDVLLTALIAYTPLELSPVRVLVAVIQLAFMAATMALVAQWVLEDY
ncbi:MAG: hypothetical protein K0S68_511 [Candidatus Saccharibacteria bacterium]|nr:hypothetical protein [Candidatus Saccharibacteria bacterium]